MKIYIVTTARRLSKQHSESRVVGFVSCFGWESQRKALEKAAYKYPGMGNWSVHLKRR
jgi:hypothetical protein